MKSFYGETQLEHEEDAIDDALASGEITREQHAKEMRELHRSYRNAAEESAREAYEQELDRWR